MKKKFRFTHAIFLLIVSSVYAVSTHAATYHLICRGGSVGNTSLQVTTYANADDGDRFNVNVFYRFQRYTGAKASVKTDGSHLAPGQCSWSTGPLQSTYRTMIHTIVATNLTTTVVFVPNISADGTFFEGGPGTNLEILPDRNDPNQRYLPAMQNFMIATVVNGSIFDQAMIFHFYVSINPDNTLQLQRVIP